MSQHRVNKAKYGSTRSRTRSGISIAQRQDGRWALTVELPRGLDGQRRRHQRTFTTYEEARAASRTFDYAAAVRTPAGAQTMTVTALLDHWAAQQTPGEDSTQINRAWMMALINQRAGTQRVTALDAGQVQGLLQHVGQTHARRTVQKVHQVLRGSLERAVSLGIIARNPAADIRPPTLAQREPEQAWDQTEVAAILTAARSGRIYTFVVLALATGARIGELIAARREDYDPATGVLTIAGTAKRGGGRGKTKTAAGHRAIALPSTVRHVMHCHLAEIDGWRQLAGPLWGQRQITSETTRGKQRAASRKPGDGALPDGWMPPAPPAQPYIPLIPTLNGTPWLRGNVARHWRAVLQRAGLPHRRMHSTRAAFITAALRDPEVSLADIQFAVGHATPVMTLRYAQQLRGQQGVVAAAASRHLGVTQALETEREKDPFSS